MTTTQELGESSRIVSVGRDVQRWRDCQIIKARIAVLRATPNSLIAALAAEELQKVLNQMKEGS